MAKKSKELMDLKEVDEPIREIIRSMNLLGYETYACCAGYRYPGHQDKTDKSKVFQDPYVCFDSTLEKAHILSDAISTYFWDIILFQGGFEMHYNTKHGGNSQTDRKDAWGWVKITLDNIKRDVN